jgi:putative transposase
MPTTKEKNYYPLMQPGRFYHVYNRGNNGDNIFYQSRNYDYFLRRYLTYLSPVLDTYCYCLLPNHFHLLVRVKEELVVPASFKPQAEEGESLPGAVADLAPYWVSELFRRFFISYSQAIIKQQGRKSGSLFVKRFKRIEVDSDAYFTNLILYIHANAQLHGLCPDFRDYPYCSYRLYFNNRPTSIRRTELLEWFGSVAAFEQAHLQRVQWDVVEPVLIEEDDLFL